jgi:UPF0271 protein
MASVDSGLMLVGLSGSALIDAGREAGLRTASEVFADRGYRADGSLLPRDATAAVVHDAALVSARAVDMVQHQGVTIGSGQRLPLQAETICIHGDTPGAPALARAVRRALEQAGVDVRAMGA